MLKKFFKYRLYLPIHLFRFIYFNTTKIKKSGNRTFFYFTPYSIFDIAKSAHIYINQSVIFGWCNMHKSRLETALCMDEKSLLILTGGGKNMLIGYGSYIQIGKNAELTIGNSFINREVKIICNKKITIGNDCIIAMGVIIRDNDGGSHKILSPEYQNCKPITIGNHVWIGENVIILKGVTIGEGCVIAAGSLVTKDIPPYSLVMGSPAKVVRTNIQWEA